MTILLEQAGHLLLEKSFVMPAAAVPLAECYGRILAQNVVAGMDFPPFDRSPLDGYAVRYADVKSAGGSRPVVLQVIEDLPAGSLPKAVVTRGTAARIMTGAPIPAGADAVVRLEDTADDGNTVRIMTAAGTNRNICRQGEEFQQGATVLTKGTVLKDGALGILAMFGNAEPLVYERPRIAILATGTEVIDVKQPLSAGKIRDSNSYMLAAKVREAGGEPVLLGQAGDHLEEIAGRLRQPENIDLYITTGGASVGDYDLMGKVFARLSVQPLFARVAIKPGMPVLAGCWGSRLLVALSGNPAAAGVSFEVLIRPLLLSMAGAAVLARTRVRVLLKEKLTRLGPVRRFVWAKCEASGGRLTARPLLLQRNGMLAGLLSANALLDIPAGSPALSAGDEVTAMLF